MRRILHIDFNSFFASVEQQANPTLRGKPIGVTGKRTERSVVAAASREAKALGVKTAMSTWEAKKICPSIILVPGDPEKYAHIHYTFNRILRRYSDKVEVFSVDECFVDITDETTDDLDAIAIAQRIKTDLRAQCGELITASVGIAPNKLLAKLASERIKPDGLTLVHEEEAVPFIDQSELQDLCGIGPRIAKRLETIGVTDFPSLRACSSTLLVRAFKKYGWWLYQAARGIDHSPVITESEDPKSVGHSHTLPADTWDANAMRRYLLLMCDRVAYRLRRDGFIAGRISAYVRYGDFSSDGKQHRSNEPTANGLTLFKQAWNLLETIRDDQKPVRLLGISASDLVRAKEPVGLFPKDQKLTKLLPALDRLQTRYGTGAWTRASLVSTDIKTRTSGFHFDHEL
ncbi:DNA polymerase IV [Candidatus Uhrbacteria bacterium]|nr:DNA polymerase IV [Candidatus Uhrbacteria bacterium]